MGAAIDITLQMTFLTLDGTSVEEAYNQVDWSSALYSGVETFHSNWVSTSTMACLRTSFKEMGNERYDYLKVGYECLSSLTTNYAAHKIVNHGDKYLIHLAKSLKNKPIITIEWLKRLKLDKEMVEWIIAKAMNESAKNYESIVNEIYE